METIELYSGAINLSLYNNKPTAKLSEVVKEIVMDNLGEGDLFLIQTNNSVYSFAVTDVKKRQGILIGGSLGKKRLRAFFICSESGQKGDTATMSTKLSVGSRAAFTIIEKFGISSHLMTSEIKMLTIIKAVLGERTV